MFWIPRKSIARLTYLNIVLRIANTVYRILLCDISLWPRSHVSAKHFNSKLPVNDIVSLTSCSSWIRVGEDNHRYHVFSVVNACTIVYSFTMWFDVSLIIIEMENILTAHLLNPLTVRSSGCHKVSHSGAPYGSVFGEADEMIQGFAAPHFEVISP